METADLYGNLFAIAHHDMSQPECDPVLPQRPAIAGDVIAARYSLADNYERDPGNPTKERSNTICVRQERLDDDRPDADDQNEEPEQLHNQCPPNRTRNEFVKLNH